MKLESKIGKIEHSDEKIYTFLADFNNFKNLIPEDKVKDWQSDENSCRFRVDPIGEIGVLLTEKEPYKLIKLQGAEKSPHNFTFWVQLKSVGPEDTRIKLTLRADLNPMLQMMAKKPLQGFLDKLVDQLGKFDFGS